ncbi:MAG: hypothetical protein ACK5O7_07155 [Holosporales bacterium]
MNSAEREQPAINTQQWCGGDHPYERDERAVKANTSNMGAPKKKCPALSGAEFSVPFGLIDYLSLDFLTC